VFTADVQREAVLESHGRPGPGRVVVAQQEPPCLLVPDAHDVPAEQRGRAGVVGVVVRVDKRRLAQYARHDSRDRRRAHDRRSADEERPPPRD
jgi:hypothetical protein